MGLVRGEDFTFIANFDSEEFDVSDIQTARLSIQNRGEPEHHGINELIIDTAANEVRYNINQIDSLAFIPNTNIQFELNLLTNDRRHCVVKYSTSLEDTLLNEVLETGHEPATKDDIIDILIQGGTIGGGNLKIDYFNDRVQVVSEERFIDSFGNFKSITLPNVQVCYEGAFEGSDAEVVRLARCNRIFGDRVFWNNQMQELYLPSLRNVNVSSSDSNFTSCNSLAVLDIGFVLPNLFDNPNLSTLIMRAFVEPTSTNVFHGTPFSVDEIEYDEELEDYVPVQTAGGYVYVPQELLTQFRASINWSTYAHVLEFRAIEGSDYE